jgi:hypothetical protein
MKFGLLACGLIASISSVASATALTYKLLANEKACFFTYVEQKGAKIAFYFAVSISNFRINVDLLAYTNAGAIRRFIRC